MLRKPDSIPSNDTIIEDPALEPFFVSRSQTGGYTLYERVIKGENDTEYIKTVCYPSNFANALKKAAEELLNVKKEYKSIKSYVTEYRGIQSKITNIME
jgi:hypothetical protein|tara:strand:+ start:1853 stop:2149 length:297 start_codon:yes stop_codon:yes gene_type:complete